MTNEYRNDKMGHHHRMYRYYIQEDIMHGFMPIHLKTEKAQKKKNVDNLISIKIKFILENLPIKEVRSLIGFTHDMYK